jgi:hypothetical protein
MPFAETWAISDLTIAPDERLYAVAEVREGDTRLFTYHPSTDTARDLGVLIPFSQVQGVSDLTIAPDGRLYGVATVSKWDDARLFVYDPRANEVRDLGAFVSGRWIRNLVAGADSRIHGYVQVEDFDPMIFSYDPSLDKVIPVKIPAPTDRWNYTNDQLVLGNDGVLYGAIERFECHTVFALNLDNGAVITQAMPGRIRVLIPHPDNGVYLGTEQGLWTFDLTGKSLIELPHPLGATALAVNQLIIHDDGRLYGCGTYHSCRLVPFHKTTLDFLALRRLKRWALLLASNHPFGRAQDVA